MGVVAVCSWENPCIRCCQMTMGCGQHGGVGVAFYGVVCWPGVKTCPIFLKALKIGPTKREQKEIVNIS